MSVAQIPTQATRTAPADALRDAASFRDPSGFVFEYDHCIYRAVDRRMLDVWRRLSASGLIDRLATSGAIVATRFVDDADRVSALNEIAPEAAGFLQHARVPTISYPYEWSPSMLADAGLLTLSLQQRLLEHGMALKDATAYNVQFVDAHPVFIDIASIEQPQRADIWHAMGQFHRMFTQPLLLHRRRGQSLRAYFLAHLDGASPEEASSAFGYLERFLPAVLMDVTLPAWLGRRTQSDAGTPATQKGAGRTANAQRWNLQRLCGKLQRLAGKRQKNDGWSGYTEACNYSENATTDKVFAVQEYLQQTRPGTVLDVGCNTGTYSLAAEATGARVIAIDSDVACVDALYRKAREQRARILPLCVDLANPSPAIGFMNRERPAFLTRAKCDCVLALAVIHHLHVAANLPLSGICDMFASLARRDLVLEFVPRTDSMFRRLTRFRSESYPDYTLEACERAFARRFTLIRKTAITDSDRTLLFLRRRDN
ncbi:MAG: class I SAM-dependent methyltransferase [Phycisphaerales bacterium]|nr:class I SAM-dependent methyltransferase [Phycisphaerales bacterium]